MGKKLIEVIDELTAIGNAHGFDNEVEVFLEDQSCGLVVMKKTDDSVGGDVMVRVGCVDVPLSQTRFFEDA